MDPRKRVNYTHGLVLGVDDFQQEQSYHKENRRLLNRFLHGYGIVCGLLVKPTDPPSEEWVFVEPGLALDPLGREVVVSTGVQLDLSEYPGSESGMEVAEQSTVYVTLEYQESETDPVPVTTGPAQTPEEATAPSRILETFQLGVRAEPVARPSDLDQELVEKIAAAIRRREGPEALYALLSQAVSQPCSSPVADAALTLAAVDLPIEGPILAEHIHNHTHREIVLSSARIFELLQEVFE